MAVAIFLRLGPDERLNHLGGPLSCFGLAILLGWLAVTGRTPRWPWE
jgi:hypothetical protein